MARTTQTITYKFHTNYGGFSVPKERTVKYKYREPPYLLFYSTVDWVCGPPYVASPLPLGLRSPAGDENRTPLTSGQRYHQVTPGARAGRRPAHHPLLCTCMTFVHVQCTSEASCTESHLQSHFRGALCMHKTHISAGQSAPLEIWTGGPPSRGVSTELCLHLNLERASKLSQSGLWLLEEVSNYSCMSPSSGMSPSAAHTSASGEGVGHAGALVVSAVSPNWGGLFLEPNPSKYQATGIVVIKLFCCFTI